MDDDEKTASDLTIPDATEINSTELRTHTRTILERAKYRGERFVVYTHGQAMAVVMGVEEFGRLKKSTEDGHVDE